MTSNASAFDRPPEQPTRERSLTHGESGDLARLAKALGHPARVRIVKALVARNGCVAGELADELPLAASTVSQHLKILKEAGLIKGEVDGPRRCYCIDRSVLVRLKNLVREL
jgi:ArsR family transcriptional regulator